VALAVLVPLGVRYEHHLRHHLLHPGDYLIPISVATIDGGSATIAANSHPQIINVFATWCVPCRMEMPAFAAAARKLRRAGVDVIGVDQEESGAQVAQFAREFSLNYPLYIDHNGITHDVLGARMIPNTIYVDARGVIRWQHAGPMTAQDLEQLSFLATTRE